MSLVHAHVCRTCGHAQRREDVDNRAIGSGLIECSCCGLRGALNLQVLEESQISRDLPHKRPPHRA